MRVAAFMSIAQNSKEPVAITARASQCGGFVSVPATCPIERATSGSRSLTAFLLRSVRRSVFSLLSGPLLRAILLVLEGLEDRHHDLVHVLVEELAGSEQDG